MFSTQLKTGLLLAFTFVAIFSFGLNSNEANVRRSSAVEEFTVQTNANGQVTLSWKQNEEFENDLFSIERSTDGEAWFKIAEIHPLENRQITRSYDYVDETPLNGISFYRVKSITTSGDRWNAEPEMVYLENDQQVKIFPVSALGELHVYLKKSILIDAQLFGPSGIPIEVNFLREGYSLRLDTKKLNPGKYNLTLITKNATINRQVMII